MFKGEVIQILIEAGYMRAGAEWTLDDNAYDPLPVAFVEQAFEDWVHSLPAILCTVRDLGGGKTRIVPKWIPEVYDCDNHARSFANFLDEALAVDAAVKGITRGNPSAGKFNFTRDDKENHARTWFIDTNRRARSFDPGMGELVTESIAELGSIFGGESI
jgi:hypothetical protein